MLYKKNSPTPVTKPRPKKEFWDKVDILSKPAGAFFTAITITALGYFSQRALTTISQSEQSSRLYTQLLASRESAESALRKDMFAEVMSGFFTQLNEDDIEAGISKKVLKLELLALNFGDSLSLGPLFSELSKDIKRTLKKNKNSIHDWKVVSGKYQRRLRALARQVASLQHSTIYPGGSKPISMHAELSKIEKNDQRANNDWTYRWPDISNGGDPNEQKIITFDGVKRGIVIRLRNADYEHRTVEAKLVIYEYIPEEIEGEDEEILLPKKVTDVEFTLDFFSFPLIDNTRLSSNHRFSLVLNHFDLNEVKISGVVFPGSYAGHKDKPFLDEAINALEQIEDQ